MPYKKKKSLRFNAMIRNLLTLWGIHDIIKPLIIRLLLCRVLIFFEKFLAKQNCFTPNLLTMTRKSIITYVGGVKYTFSRVGNKIHSLARSVRPAVPGWGTKRLQFKK